MNTPKVSIIIPNYNHESFLKQRIESVLQQTVQDIEVILLDDCSTDKSISVLNTYKEHPKVTQVVLNTQNSGSPFKQWQKGIALAKGEYIWFAESDDYCQLNFLEEILAVFHKNLNLGIVYAQSNDVDEHGKKLFSRLNYTQDFSPNIWENDFECEGELFVKEYLQIKNVIPNASAVVFKKSLVKSDKVFSNSLLQMTMCGDWLFWIQLAKQTKIGFIAEPLNCFRQHSGVTRNHSNITRKKTRLLEESVLRSFLQEKNVFNTSLETLLYQKWFKLHKASAILTKSYYKIKLFKSTRVYFLRQVIMYYLKK